MSRAVLIVIPVFNDWDAAALLIDRIDAVFNAEAISADILISDDGSS